MTVMITGASAGVGRALARMFAERDGASIGLIARGQERLAATAEEVRRLGGDALALPADVADATAVAAAAEQAERAFGPIDTWVNCAMVTLLGSVEDTRAEEFRRITAVTYLGCVHGTMTALDHMTRHNRGTIIQVGSALAYRSIPLQAAYCAAKHAIVGFTDSLRCELIHQGSPIQVSVVHLPALNTPQFDWMRNKLPRQPQPLPPIFQPEVAADAVYFAAHHPRREFWVGASTIEAILGQRLAPGLLDRYLARQAYSGQQSAAAAEVRPDNLFEPGSGDPGAHGRFNTRARDRSLVFEIARAGPRRLAGGLALGAGVLWWLLRRRHRRRR